MEENMKYEEAVRELESLVEKMGNGDIDIDVLAENLKKAQNLLKMCKDKLTKTEDEIQKLLANVQDSL